MASNWIEVFGKLKQDKAYVNAFEAVFEEGMSARSISHAIAVFQRSLTTPNAPFDRFLQGDNSAITEQEKRGYLLFKSYGCSSCHQGRSVGRNMYEKMGVHGDYFADRGDITNTDYGRFNVTGREEHEFKFKVPSLRNVELTAPYFHDGWADSLELAVLTMAKYQLGRQMPVEDLELIVDFLRTLTGEFNR